MGLQSPTSHLSSPPGLQTSSQSSKFSGGARGDSLASISSNLSLIQSIWKLNKLSLEDSAIPLETFLLLGPTYLGFLVLTWSKLRLGNLKTTQLTSTSFYLGTP